MAAMALAIIHSMTPRCYEACQCNSCGMGSWRTSDGHVSSRRNWWMNAQKRSRIVLEQAAHKATSAPQSLERREFNDESGNMSEEEGTSEECSDDEQDEPPGFESYEFLDEPEKDEDVETSMDTLAQRAEKIDELCANVRAGNHNITARQLTSLYSFKVDKFQRLAIKAFLRGSSVVVSAPTSSGKTLIAEAAAAATLARGRRLFYTTPLKALSNQKFREFRSVFGEASVGLLTGDISVNRDAPIVIMTAEILRNKLYLSAGSQESETLVGVDVVILDEIHYLSDISRGTVWEEMVIYCPKNVLLICLSATVANPEELAQWITKVHGPTELITSSKRPVPLMWHISRRSGMSPILNSRGTGIHKKLLIGMDDLKRIKRRNVDETSVEESLQLLQRIEVPRISETLKQMVQASMLPAIWFILSRKRCDQSVQYLNDAALLSPEEVEKVDHALKSFREQHPDGVREAAVKALYQGVAAHHAGCLPVWKSFIEELFQRGLVKVVFATETLAAGINMPARTTVLSASIGKGGVQAELSANSILQMAGRAGRRGIDSLGHVVVVQTPFRGPKDCYKMLRSGSEPLVSQFTANYGMVLNLLAASSSSSEDGDETAGGSVRSLSEARGLVEQSFGNFIGSDILVGSKAKLLDLEEEIEILEAGGANDSLSRQYHERVRDYNNILEKKKAAERKVASLERKFEKLRTEAVQKKLQLLKNELPYVPFSYIDIQTGEERTVSSICVDKLSQSAFAWALKKPDHDSSELHREAAFVALGADNCWYRFSAEAVKSIHRSGLSIEHYRDVLEIPKARENWEQIGDQVLVLRGFSDSTSLNVPSSDELPPKVEFSMELQAAETLLLSQQRGLEKLSRKLMEFDPLDMESLSVKVEKLRKEKISRLKSKYERISNRIKQMVPSGWNEFLQAVKVLKAAKAMDQETCELLPLGEIAKAIRGTNELWLALALQDEALVELKPEELAAVASTLVNESKKTRFENPTSSIYEASNAVQAWVGRMEARRQWLINLQEKHFLEFPCDMDPQVAGFVEAWASGVNWKELEISDFMDEGDFARLLRRTIDLLAQVPHLPHIDHLLVKNAKTAAKYMDRPPISEPVAE